MCQFNNICGSPAWLLSSSHRHQQAHACDTTRKGVHVDVHALTRVCTPHTHVHTCREPALLPAGTCQTPIAAQCRQQPGAMLLPQQPAGKLMPIITKAPKLPAPNLRVKWV